MGAGSLAAQDMTHAFGRVQLPLHRLETGTYGICERCGQPVGDERLAARPAAVTCIRCAAKGSR